MCVARRCCGCAGRRRSAKALSEDERRGKEEKIKRETPEGASSGASLADSYSGFSLRYGQDSVATELEVAA